MDQSFGQFCPIALASEVLTQRWMLLVIHELLAGSSRFNDIRRGIPKISATLLKQRLETLEDADIVVKTPIGETGNYSYTLTEAGKDLEQVVSQIGVWGQRWARDIDADDLDPGWLVWNIHRRLNIDEMPSGRTVIHIEFTDMQRRERFFWLLINAGKVDVCLKPPGFPADIKVTTTVRVFAEIWRGLRSLRGEIKKGSMIIEGKSSLRRAFPKWLLLSAFAPIKRKREATA